MAALLVLSALLIGAFSGLHAYGYAVQLWHVLSALGGILAIATMQKIFSSGVPKGVSEEQINRTADGFNELYKEGQQEKRESQYDSMVDAFYNLVTDFYEWGWGQSFHFAPRFKGEAFRESLARAEYYIAHRLHLNKGMKAIDLGCGVGGPLRSIAEFSQAHVTGVTINEYQVNRAKYHNANRGLTHLCDVTIGDFQALDKTFQLDSFDSAYAIEAIVHSPDLAQTYQQVHKVLKPGGLFACYEWVMTDKYDPQNADHVRIKKGIEHGNAIPNLRTAPECLKTLEESGFEIVDHFDFNAKGQEKTQVPWYYMLEGRFSPQGFRMTKIGRFFTTIMVAILETLWIAPKGTTKVQKFLCIAADNLAEGGRKQIFTPTYFFLAKKI